MTRASTAQVSRDGDDVDKVCVESANPSLEGAHRGLDLAVDGRYSSRMQGLLGPFDNPTGDLQSLAAVPCHAVSGKQCLNQYLCSASRSGPTPEPTGASCPERACLQRALQRVEWPRPAVDVAFLTAHSASGKRAQSPQN